jgi:hypothetical protein
MSVSACTFVHENRRDFSLKHMSGVESVRSNTTLCLAFGMLSLQFTTETGLADSWIEAFHRISADEVYENPDDDYLVMNHVLLVESGWTLENDLDLRVFGIHA